MESTSMMILRNKEHLGGRSEQKGKYDKSIVGGRWNKQQDRDKEDPWSLGGRNHWIFVLLKQERSVLEFLHTVL